MDKRTILVGIVALALGGAAHAATIPIFNTGVDGSGNPLPDQTIGDPHYTLVSVPGGTTTIMVRDSTGGFPIPPWVGDDSASAWIGPASDTQLDGPVGVFDYQTSFDLTGLIPGTASISGQWSEDNEGVDILINGVSTGNTGAGFTSWSSFTINSGFIAGVNTLDFLVNNDGGPTGLRVELSGTATPLGSVSSTPEPSSLLLFGPGFAGFLMLRRRFQAR